MPRALVVCCEGVVADNVSATNISEIVTVHTHDSLYDTRPRRPALAGDGRPLRPVKPRDSREVRPNVLAGDERGVGGRLLHGDRGHARLGEPPRCQPGGWCRTRHGRAHAAAVLPAAIDHARRHRSHDLRILGCDWPVFDPACKGRPPHAVQRSQLRIRRHGLLCDRTSCRRAPHDAGRSLRHHDHC